MPSRPAPGHASPRRSYSLRFTLVAALCGITVAVGAVLAVGTSTMVRDFMHEELRTRLADVVSVMASQIDVDRHSRVTTQADEQGPDYQALQAQLRGMRESGPNIAYAYTMRLRADGQPVFVIDSAAAGDDFSHVGSVYDEATPALAAALDAGPGVATPFVEQELSSDPWGTWLSAFRPLYTADGRQDGIVGIDVSAASVQAHQRQYQIVVWSVSGVLVLLMLPASFWLARRIRRPLATLAEEMGKVREFDLDGEARVVSRITEIQEMADRLEDMKRGLRAFRKYMPEELVRELIELGVEAKPGGRREEVTVFFSDIANFTNMSEGMEPDVLMRFMEEYLTIMNRSLLQNRATVDKYLGDGVMAFWGAPRKMADHAVHACLAALDCQRAIDELNVKWERDGYSYNFFTRIGIHTGEVVVGNVGSAERMNYTVIGRNVNSTSRIEGINKYYGTRILVTDATVAQTGDRFLTRPIDKAVLAGNTRPLGLYELMDTQEGASAADRELATLYTDAFTRYGQRRFEEAVACFDTLLARFPEDAPSKVMRERCRKFVATPPPPEWQGEHVFLRK